MEGNKTLPKTLYLSLDRAVLIALRAMEPGFVTAPKVIALSELVGAVRLATKSSVVDEEDVLMSLTTLAANLKFRRMDVVQTDEGVQVVIEGEGRNHDARPSVTEAGKRLGLEWSQYWLTKEQRAVVRSWGKVNSQKIRTFIREFEKNTSEEILKDHAFFDQVDREYADEIVSEYKAKIEEKSCNQNSNSEGTER